MKPAGPRLTPLQFVLASHTIALVPVSFRLSPPYQLMDDLDCGQVAADHADAVIIVT